MKGIQAAVDTSFVPLSSGNSVLGDAKGINMGKLGLVVADNGNCGSESISGVSPGTKTTTTL